MKIYNYEKDSGAFVSQGVADESPLEPGQFLIPANATEIAPPKCGAYEVPVFANGKWAVVPDYRGQTYFDASGAEHVITQVGVKPEPGWTSEYTPSPEDEQEKENAKHRAYLSATDWYVIRSIETGTPVPDDITKARAAARAAIVE